MLTEFKNLVVFDVFRLDGAIWTRYNTSSDKKVPNCKACNDLGVCDSPQWKRVEDDEMVELIKQNKELENNNAFRYEDLDQS